VNELNWLKLEHSSKLFWTE